MQGTIGSGRLWLLYLQCYFIAIAMILGTGVLGLPVTLYKSGFYPFLLFFTLNWIMQVFLIVLMTELLQYCKGLLSDPAHSMFTALGDGSNEVLLSRKKGSKEKEHVLFDIRTRPKASDKEFDSESDDDNNSMSGDSWNGETSDDPMSRDPITEPNLHMIGKLFLHKYLNPIYLVSMLFHFFALITSYALAGSEAFGQVLKIQYTTVIPFFTWILAIIVIIGRQAIRPVIAIMTLAKGSFLIATVGVTIYTGAAVQRTVTDDWAHVDQPLLMGSVAIGGVPMVMPMLFDKFEAVRDQMKGFRNSLIGGLTTCFILNVCWCWSVLRVVPQTYASCHGNSAIVDQNSTDSYTTTPPEILSSSSLSQITCDPDITLEAANRAGLISTVPLTEIILADHKDLKWIAIVIQMFILISITVSFLTLGSALQHTVCGWIDDSVAKSKTCRLTGSCGSVLPSNWFWHYLFGVMCFTVVFVVAMIDPKGFVSLLEKLTSPALNLMSGLFMFLMVRSARSRPNRHIRISLTTHRCLAGIHYVTLVFFTFMVIYDIVISVLSWVRPQ